MSIHSTKLSYYNSGSVKTSIFLVSGHLPTTLEIIFCISMKVINKYLRYSSSYDTSLYESKRIHLNLDEVLRSKNCENCLLSFVNPQPIYYFEKRKR